MFKFLPIGGVGFIGGNVSYMELDTFPFLIDSGILFPKEQSLGMDHLFPNLDVLKDSPFKEPKYLLLTHAHEDHIGGLKHLIKVFPQIQIVCSDYTIEFINKKFPKFNLNLVTTTQFTQSYPFFEFFKLRHSIPGVYGFHYTRNEKSVLFCTDFRFDKDEKDCLYLSPTLLKKYSKSKNKIALLDSTNISSNSKSTKFEKDLFESLKSEIKVSTQDTFITFFPSNIERLAAIVKVCNDLNRPCCLAGYSVEFSYSLGLSVGLIPPIKDSVYHKGRSIVLLSGSQGDLRGAFRRVFTQNDKKFKPTHGDRLLYSSKVIPGNEKSVGDMFNKASEAGLIINKGTNPVIHASGHAYADEISSIVDSYFPNHIIPIHLESSFFQEFMQKIQPQFPKILIHRLENYKLLEIENDIKFKTSEFEKLDLQIYLEGGELVDKGVINNRRRLGNSGAVFISLNKDISSAIKVNYYGTPELNINELTSEVSKVLTAEWNSPDPQEVIRIAIRQYLNKKIGYKPLVFIHIL